MSAIAFDPWAALEKSRTARLPAKAAILANPCLGPQPGLADLAVLAGGRFEYANRECVETGHPPACVRAGDGHPLQPRVLDLSPPARASVLSRARHGGGLAVPEEWRDGVERLATMPSPARIEPQRWAAFVATAARLLHSHGPALHEGGWGTLALFGLHRRAPAAYPPGWGLAWLLGARGDVMDLAADAIGMRRESGGARLAFRRRARTAWAMPAWTLGR